MRHYYLTGHNRELPGNAGYQHRFSKTNESALNIYACVYARSNEQIINLLVTWLLNTLMGGKKRGKIVGYLVCKNLAVLALFIRELLSMFLVWH